MIIIPVPPMISNGSGVVYQCVHGGTWSVTVSVQDAKEGSSAVMYNLLTATIITPCPSTPPTFGVPPCVLGPIVGTGVLKLINSQPTVLSSDVQVSTSNGIPAIPLTFSTKVIT